MNKIKEQTMIDQSIFTDRTYSTKDYSMFKLLVGNRPVSKNNVYEKVLSIKENGYFKEQAILVTTDLHIIDGQHRFEACKELELPIYYRLMDKHSSDPNLLDIVRTLQNTQRRWNVDDVVNSFILQNNYDYKILKELHEKYSIMYSCLIVFFGSGIKENNRYIAPSRVFHSGLLKTNEKSIENINKLGSVLNLIRDLKNIKSGEASWINQASCINGLWNIITSETDNFNLDTFKDKIRLNFEKISKQKDKNSYVEMFLYIYNFRNRNTISLKGYRDCLK